MLVQTHTFTRPIVVLPPPPTLAEQAGDKITVYQEATAQQCAGFADREYAEWLRDIEEICWRAGPVATKAPVVTVAWVPGLVFRYKHVYVTAELDREIGLIRVRTSNDPSTTRLLIP